MRKTITVSFLIFIFLSSLTISAQEPYKLPPKEVLDIMKPGGGFIAGASHDTILEETPLENILAMFDTIREYGTYH